MVDDLDKRIDALNSQVISPQVPKPALPEEIGRSPSSGIPQATKLSPGEESEFKKWFSDRASKMNLNPNPDDPNHFYDSRGAWKAGYRNIDAHLPDTWKLPGHPTFSDQSMYYRPGMKAGRWEGDKYVPIDGESGGVKDDLDSRIDSLNRSISTPEQPKVGIPEKPKSWTDSPVGYGLAGYFRQSGQGLIEPFQRIGTEVNKALGLSETWAGDEKGLLQRAKEYLEPTPEQKKGMEDPFFKTIPGMVAAGAVQAPATIAKYKGLGAVLGAAGLPSLANSILTFAGIQVSEKIGKENAWEIIKGLPEAVVMGYFFDRLGPAFKKLPDGGVEVTRAGQKVMLKAPLIGALMSGQAIYDGGDMKSVISSGIIGTMLGLMSGGKGPQKGTVFEKGEGGKLIPRSERLKREEDARIEAEKTSDKEWEEKKQGFINDFLAKEEKDKALATGTKFADRMRAAEAAWKESELNKKREIVPGEEEGGPGVKISDEDAILELHKRQGDNIDFDERQEPFKPMDVGEIGLGVLKNQEDETSIRDITRMEFNPQMGEVTLGTANGGAIVLGKHPTEPGLWANRILKDGVVTEIDPHNATIQEVMDLFGWKKAGEYTDVKSFKVIPDKIETIDRSVKVNKAPDKINILEPEKSKPAGESPRGPSSPRLPLPAGEDFKGGDRVIYNGQEHLVNEVRDGKVSIYKEGKDQGGSIKEVDPGELKPASRGRPADLEISKEGEGEEKDPTKQWGVLDKQEIQISRDKADAIDEVIALEKQRRDGRIRLGDKRLMKERIDELVKKYDILGRDISDRKGRAENKYGLTKEQAETIISPEYWDELRNNIEKMGGPGTIVGFPEELRVLPEEAGALERAHGEPVTKLAGRMTATEMGNLIEVAADDVYAKGMHEGKVTASHEVIHLLEELKKITPGEIAAVDRYYEKVPRRGADKAEHRAEQLGKAIADGGFKKGELVPQAVRNVFHKIQDFLRKMVNYYEGLGYNLSDKQVVNNLIRDIADGEVAKRNANESGIAGSLGRGEIDRRKNDIQNLKNTVLGLTSEPGYSATQKAYDLGKTITRDQALALWTERKNIGKQPIPEDTMAAGTRAVGQQFLREAVAGHLGEGETGKNIAFSESEIEDKLHGTQKARIAKDVKDEVTDDFKKAHVGIIGALDGIKKAVAPGIRGPEGRKTVIGFAKELAKAEKSYDQLEASMREAEKGFDKMSKEDVFKVLQNMSTGEKQAMPELDKIEAALQGAMTDVGKAVNEKAKRMGYSDEDLIHMRENYIPGVDAESWRARQGMTQSGPLPTSRILEPTGFLKQKVFQDFNSRIEAGYEPTDWNPVRMFLPKYKEELKLLHTYTEIDNLMKDGTAVMIKPGERPPDGWVAVPEPYGTTRLGKLVMTENAGQVFNNYLSRPLSSNETIGGLYRGYMNISTALQRFQLFGLFHAGFVASEAMVSRGALAWKQLYGIPRGTTDPLTFLKTAASIPFAPVSKYLMGVKIAEERLHPGTSKDPRVIQAVEDMTRAGGGISQERMFTDYWVKEMQKDYKNGKYIGGTFKFPMAAMEVIMKPLMQSYVPHLKLGAFEELSTELRRIKPNLSDAQYDQEMHEVWNRIDSRLGQVRWQRIFMNNSAKNFIQAVIRAPGWTGGTILEIGGGVTKDPYNFFKEWHDTGKLPAALPDRAAYVLSLAVGTMVLNASMSALFANKDPSKLTMEDYMAFDTGEKDERGNTVRGMLPLYSKDVYAYVRAPASTFWHKQNPIVGLVYELSKNKDYYGTGITDPTTGLGTKIGDVGKYLAKAFIPFGKRGMDKTLEEGGSTVKSVLPPIFGIMPAPSYFSQTKATQKALELGAEKMPAGGRTQADYDRNKLLNTYFKKYVNASTNGEDTQKIMDAFSKDVQDGKLKQQDVMKFKTKLKGQPLENSVAKLSMDGAMAVWRVANDEEKRKIVPIIFKKFRNLKDPNDKQRYAGDMEKISGDLSKIYNLPGGQ